MSSFFNTDRARLDEISEWSTGNGVVVKDKPTFDVRYFMGVNSVDTTGITSTVTWTDLPWDTEKRKDALYTHDGTTNNQNITINSNGDYGISLNVGTDVSAGGNRTVSEVRLVKTNGTTTEITNSRSDMYNRANNRGSGTGSVDLIETLVNGDIVKAQIKKKIGTNTIFVDANRTRLLIKKL